MNYLKTVISVFLILAAFQTVALAAERKAYYTDEAIKGYTEGSFVILKDDEVNFRQAPENGKIIKVLNSHSLLRIISNGGEWLQADSDGVEGYIYASLTGKGSKDELTDDDFIFESVALGTRFDEQKMEDKFGEAQSKSVNKKLKRINYIYNNAVIGVAKKKKIIESVTVKDMSYISMRGVSIGDSAGRAVGQYGLPDAVVYEAETTAYEYFWYNDCKQHLRFTLIIDKNSKVIAFGLELLKK